jgi:hypothetical protein
MTITDSRGVRYVLTGPTPASFADPVTCGTCGRTWDDAVVTSVTPTPSARCPFEYEHLGNTIAREGADRCFCGCKYWENDRCIDCGTHITQVPQEDR